MSSQKFIWINLFVFFLFLCLIMVLFIPRNWAGTQLSRTHWLSRSLCPKNHLSDVMFHCLCSRNGGSFQDQNCVPFFYSRVDLWAATHSSNSAPRWVWQPYQQFHVLERWAQLQSVHSWGKQAPILPCVLPPVTLTLSSSLPSISFSLTVVPAFLHLTIPISLVTVRLRLARR